MQITRTSMVSGKTRTRDINCTPEQIATWKAGATIQSAMPQLSADDREFIMTGVTDGEWDEMWSEDDPTA